MINLQVSPIKVIFLDRDGTIIKDTGYPHNNNEMYFLPHSFDGLKKMKELGYVLFIITNQSGVSRGLFTESDYYNFTNHLLAELQKNGIEIEDVFQCFHTPENNCNCRKPNTGMVNKLLNENNIDLNKSFTIGDKKSDIDFGKNISTNTILINSELENSYSIGTEQHYRAKNLLSAYNLIENLYAA